MGSHDESKPDDTRTDLGSVSNDNKEEIDIELAKSIEKLVEEETNVAKAAMGKQEIPVRSTAAGNAGKKDAAQMKTQVLPDLVDIQLQARQAEKEKQQKSMQKAAMEKKAATETKVSLETQVIEPVKVHLGMDKPGNGKQDTDKPETDLSKKTSKTALKADKKKKILIVGIVAAVTVAAIAGITVWGISNRKSYSYNYQKAMELLKKQDYHNAKQYFAKAYQTGEGKKNVDMMYALYQCYQQDKEEQQALDMLFAILQVDKNNENALSALAQFYADKEDGDALNKLIAQYQGTDAQKLLSQYEVQAPTVSETPGQYQRELQVSLFAEDSCTIYYTTDGTQPDSGSTQYTEAIALEGGVTALKAVAVNTIGVYSPVAEFDYTINYQKPDAPVISPSSGTYEYGEKISIDAADGTKIYYTTDGTTPTTDSQAYTEPFSMPEGNIVVSAVAVDEHDLVSSVARKNYIVNPQKSYTYTEALEILKDRMKELGMLNADEQTAPNGAAAVFSYVGNVTINDTELYQIRVDLKSGTQTTTEGNYGVGIKNGKCYQITGTEGAYQASSY